MTPTISLPTFPAASDWADVTQVTQQGGAAVVQGLLGAEHLAALNAEISAYLGAQNDAGRAASGSDQYDRFLGHNTLRLHGLVEKFVQTRPLIEDPRLLGWAANLMGEQVGNVLLNAGELIQINPGEPRQALHRDTDSWPLPLGPKPIIVNAIVALDNFTLRNGATAMVPDSWQWPPERRPQPVDFTRAVMQAGDAVLFRGDLLHGGGANESEAPRRALSLSYCVGWIRPVENSFLNVSRSTAQQLSPSLQGLLGYRARDGLAEGAGMVGLYENGDPQRYLVDG